MPTCDYIGIPIVATRHTAGNFAASTRSVREALRHSKIAFWLYGTGRAWGMHVGRWQKVGRRIAHAAQRSELDGCMSRLLFEPHIVDTSVQ